MRLLENIVVANVVVKECRMKRKKVDILKSDYERAYDSMK